MFGASLITRKLNLNNIERSTNLNYSQVTEKINSSYSYVDSSQENSIEKNENLSSISNKRLTTLITGNGKILQTLSTTSNYSSSISSELEIKYLLLGNQSNDVILVKNGNKFPTNTQGFLSNFPLGASTDCSSKDIDFASINDGSQLPGSSSSGR